MSAAEHPADGPLVPFQDWEARHLASLGPDETVALVGGLERFIEEYRKAEAEHLRADQSS
jgi:hypothetical protein